MNEHNIDNFMKLAVNHKSTTDRESDPDKYYRAKYDEIASGKKFSFNWCAFLCNASWCLYRKMYLYGILLFAFQCAYATGVESISIHLTSMISSGGLKILFRIIFCIINWIPWIFFGFIGNWLYVQQIHKKIDQSYHLSTVRNTDKLTWSFAAISTIACCIGIIAFYGRSAIETGWMQYIPTVLHVLLASGLGFITVKRDEENVKAALAERALAEQGGMPSSHE
jgi:hypothetical protein